MGNALIGFDDITTGQFLVEGKIIFDWVQASSNILNVKPYEYDTGRSLCHPACGPYILQATDDGSLDPGIPVAIVIETAVAHRYLFVEYRASLGGALLTWSDMYLSVYGTGAYGNTLLADATPSTDRLDDSVLLPGLSFEVDLGLECTAGTALASVSVLAHAESGNLRVTIAPLSTLSPTATPAPSTLAPTDKPTESEEACGSPCCPSLSIGGYTYEKLSTGSSGYCCHGACSYYSSEQDLYLQYVNFFDEYFATSTLPCIESGTLYYFFRNTRDEISGLCSSNPLHPSTQQPSCAGALPHTTETPTCAPISESAAAPTSKPTSLASLTSSPSIESLSLVIGFVAITGMTVSTASNHTTVFAAAIAEVAQCDIESISVAITSGERRNLLIENSVEVQFDITLTRTVAEATALRIENSTLSQMDSALLSAVALTESDDTRAIFDNVTATAISPVTVTAIDLVPVTSVTVVPSQAVFEPTLDGMAAPTVSARTESQEPMASTPLETSPTPNCNTAIPPSTPTQQAVEKKKETRNLHRIILVLIVFGGSIMLLCNFVGQFARILRRRKARIHALKDNPTVSHEVTFPMRGIRVGHGG